MLGCPHAWVIDIVVFCARTVVFEANVSSLRNRYQFFTNFQIQFIPCLLITRFNPYLSSYDYTYLASNPGEAAPLRQKLSQLTFYLPPVVRGPTARLRDGEVPTVI